MFHAMRSFTAAAANELFSNAVEFPGLRPDDIAGGSAATWISLVRVFLHESAHHDSNVSVVGQALAAVAFHPALGEGELSSQELNDLEVFQNVRRLFDPLMEGIATFAEFDASPTSAPLLSAPMHRLAAAVVARNFEEMRDELNSAAQDPLALTAQLLSDSRLSEEGMAHKRLLLSSPLRLPFLESEMAEPYLTGYLFVKRLRALLIRHPEIRADADFTLAFLMAYFFGDFTLANRILATQHNPVQQFIEIQDYLLGRLKLLEQRGIEFVDEYASRCTHHDGNPVGPHPDFLPDFCNYTPEAEAEFLERLRARLDQASPQLRQTLEGRARACFQFGSTDCRIVVGSHRDVEVFVPGSLLWVPLGVLPDAHAWWADRPEDSEWPGQLVMTWLPAPGFEMVYLVFSDDTFLGTVDAETLMEHPVRAGYWTEGITPPGLVRDVNERIVNLWEVRNGLSTSFFTSDLTQTVALGRPWSRLSQAVQDVLRKQGIAGLFVGRQDLLESLIRLSTLLAASPGIEIDGEVARSIPFNRDMLAEIQSIGRQALGFDLLVTDDRRMWMCLV